MNKQNNKSDKPRHAFILAAGEGTRLRPYTDNCPKPLIPVNNRPILDYTLDKLEKSDVQNVTINLSYLGDRIEKHLSSRTTPKITFSKETELLNTGGGVKKALKTMKGKPFYLINGDAFWMDGKDKNALDRLAQTWNSNKMDILLLLQPVKEMILTEGIGDYDLTETGKAVRSKNRSGTYMFSGIRITKSTIFENTPDSSFSFLELMDRAEKEGRLYGLIHDGAWHHISTPKDLNRVNAAIATQETLKQAKTA